MTILCSELGNEGRSRARSSSESPASLIVHGGFKFKLRTPTSETYIKCNMMSIGHKSVMYPHNHSDPSRSAFAVTLPSSPHPVPQLSPSSESTNSSALPATLSPDSEGETHPFPPLFSPTGAKEDSKSSQQYVRSVSSHVVSEILLNPIPFKLSASRSPSHLFPL